MACPPAHCTPGCFSAGPRSCCLADRHPCHCCPCASALAPDPGVQACLTTGAQTRSCEALAHLHAVAAGPSHHQSLARLQAPVCPAWGRACPMALDASQAQLVVPWSCCWLGGPRQAAQARQEARTWPRSAAREPVLQAGDRMRAGARWASSQHVQHLPRTAPFADHPAHAAAMLRPTLPSGYSAVAWVRAPFMCFTPPILLAERLPWVSQQSVDPCFLRVVVFGRSAAVPRSVHRPHRPLLLRRLAASGAAQKSRQYGRLLWPWRRVSPCMQEGCWVSNLVGQCSAPKGHAAVGARQAVETTTSPRAD